LRESGRLGDVVRKAYKVYKSINIMKKKAEPAQQSNKLSIIFLTKLISSHQVDGCGRRLRKEANRLKLNEWQEMVGSISRPG